MTWESFCFVAVLAIGVITVLGFAWSAAGQGIEAFRTARYWTAAACALGAIGWALFALRATQGVGRVWVVLP